MRRILLLIVVLFLLSVVSYSEENNNQSSNLSNSYFFNFGTIKEGLVVKHKFIIKNEDQNELVIKDAITSCGCTTFKIKDSLLEPNQTTEVDVEFNTTGYSGKVNQYVYLVTNNETNSIITLELEGEVLK